MYIYIYIYIYTAYKYTCVHTQFHTYNAYADILSSTFIHACIYTYIHDSPRRLVRIFRREPRQYGCMYVHMHVCMYVCVCICMCVLFWREPGRYVCIYAHVCACVCVCVSACVIASMSVCESVCLFVHVCVCACVRVCVCECIWMHHAKTFCNKHAYIYLCNKHTYMHAYMYMHAILTSIAHSKIHLHKVYQGVLQNIRWCSERLSN